MGEFEAAERGVIGYPEDFEASVGLFGDEVYSRVVGGAVEVTVELVGGPIRRVAVRSLLRRILVLASASEVF